MSQFDSVLSSLKNENFSDKKQLLEYLLHIVQNIQKSKKSLEEDDRKALLEYAYGEVDAFLAAIPKAKTYQEKDMIFACEDLLLGLVMSLCPSADAIPGEALGKISALVDLVARERYLENAIDRLFEKDTVEAAEAESLLALVKRTEEEYHRGKLYAGLVHYKDRMPGISAEVKALFADYLTSELRCYLDLEVLHEDCIINLELAADVSKYVADDVLISLLYNVLKLGRNHVNYYIAETLLFTGRGIPADVIDSLAHDLGYADLTFTLLSTYGKQALFPKECTSPEYLAKSDLVHWLLYPTELGKAPDEIEYIGKITYLFKKEVYHVFKFRSDSDTLDDGLKNKWLIGWSSNEGGTFSNFDEYALFEKGTVDATLKNIKKKLIG